MMPDFSHHCVHGGVPAPGAIPVVRKASSHCCGVTLAEGGTEAAGFTCTGCGGAASRVLGPPVAHWTCLCGQRRSQEVSGG